MYIKHVLPLLFLSFSAVSVSAQNSLAGYVRDAETGETLIGATVQLQALSGGTVTNAYGFFSMARPQVQGTLISSYVGYASDTLMIDAETENPLNINLSPKGTGLQTVLVSSASGQRAIQPTHTPTVLTTADIKRIPPFAGEYDLIKAIQIDAGVKNNSEGSSAMFVRGGGADQNLVLLDEARIYNPAHLFGLVSVFNTDALKDVRLHKGTFPARYGGRTAAVLDVRSQDGNLKESRWSGGLSPLTARLSFTGPLIQDRAGLMVGVRRSLFDLFVEPGRDVELEPRFVDVNLRAQVKLNDTDQLLLSAYYGRDELRSDQDFENAWGNGTASLRCVHQLNDRWFSTATLIHSNYQNDLSFGSAGLAFTWRNALTSSTLKYDFSFYPSDQQTVYLGLETHYHQFTPGSGNDAATSIPTANAIEPALYLQHVVQLGERLSLDYGLRFSGQVNVGNSIVFDYTDGIENPQATSVSGAYHRELSLEPRLKLAYQLSSTSSLNGGIARAAQYQHLLRNSSLAYSSLETWFPSNPNISPLRSWTADLGYAYSPSTAYSGSVEVFARRTTGQLDYLAQASFIDNPFVEGQVRAGETRAYGMEVSVKKTEGQLTGALNYSYSRALNTIPEINDGREYPAYWDIPHALSLNLRRGLSPRLFVSLVGILSSGRPITLPVGFYEGSGGRVIPIYSERNAERVALYHRVDLAVTLSPGKKVRRLRSTWSGGVYNLYNRKNPIGYELAGRSGGLSVSQYALFGAVPFVSWSFKFIVRQP